MNLGELALRLEKGEDLHTEFKEWPIPPDDVAPSIVAFANTDGGQLVLGVDHKGQMGQVRKLRPLLMNLMLPD